MMFSHNASVAVALLMLVGCSSGPTLRTDEPDATSAATPAPTLRPTPAPTPTATPVNTDEAAWVVQRWTANNTKIQVLDSDGKDLVTVSSDPDGTFPTNPDWSPDGQQITFVMTDESRRDDLWVVNVDGSDARRVYDCADACANLDDPAWSPDGQSIAACKNSNDANHPAELVSVDVETGEEVSPLIPGLNQFCAGPRWSPDGRQIVLEMVSTDGAAVDPQVTGVVLSIVDLSQRFPSARGLTHADQFAATADWSRETDVIVFNQRPEAGVEENDLYTIAPDGAGLTRVTYLADKGSGAYEPSFNADGTAVVFHSGGVLRSVDLATGEVELAFGDFVQGNHPRSRPLP